MPFLPLPSEASAVLPSSASPGVEAAPPPAEAVALIVRRGPGRPKKVGGLPASKANKPSERDWPLYPWEREYARFLLKNEGASKDDQVAFATEYKQRKVCIGTLYDLRKSPQFKEFTASLVLKARQAAERRFDLEMDGAVKAHFDGLRSAIANDDYKAIPSFTDYILKVAKPTKQEAAAQAPQIVVNVSLEQQRLLQATPIDVESEEVVIDAELVE